MSGVIDEENILISKINDAITENEKVIPKIFSSIF